MATRSTDRVQALIGTRMRYSANENLRGGVQGMPIILRDDRRGQRSLLPDQAAS